MVYLVLLLFLFGLIFVLAERWDSIKHQLLLRLFIFLLLVGAALFGVRYWLVSSIGCIPHCVGASLVGRDLAGFDLNEANFVEAKLSGATLAKAKLRGADLSGADLLQVNLEGADLQNAKLLGSNLQGANLAGANLTGTDLSGANLTAADLTGVDLTKTTLYGVRLNNVELVGSDLTGTQLAAVELSGAKMNGARLINTNLSGAVLSQADLSGARLNGTNLSGSWLNLALLIGADLTNADLAGASLIGADLASADLSDSRLMGANFVGANLAGANFNGANLANAKIQATELITSDSLDPTLQALNELQRGRILVDADLNGITFNAQTTWPNADLAAAMAASQDTSDSSVSEAAATIKVGVLHSLTGFMATSEMAVRDATLLAIEEINQAGGVLGQPIEPVVEDGASTPATFAEKTRKLLASDGVAAIFGGWTSDSRKAMLPVLDELGGLLFYPLQYEGFESSPNVFYLGAEPSQQIVPAVNYLISQGYTQTLLIGSDALFPRTANAIVKAQMAAAGYTVAGEVYIPLGEVDFTRFLSQLQASPPNAIFNTLTGSSNIAFFQQLQAAGFTAKTLPVLSVSMAEEEVRAMGPEVATGQLTAWTYYQTVTTPENFQFVTAYKTAYGTERVTSDPIEAGYMAVYLWKLMVEQAQSTAVADVRAAAATDQIEWLAPEGVVRVDGKTQHLYKTARIGVIRPDGLIDQVVASEAPIKPDPFLTQYPWAESVRAQLEAAQSQPTPTSQSAP
ncbi:MAG: transporter substrate-binding protein [Caldilineaceae bacterium]|nr:transporter substrate-binding protein [Caldilineaceae bacterium]